MRPSIYAFSPYGELTRNPLTDFTNNASFDIEKGRDIKRKIEEGARNSEADYPAFRYFGADMSNAMEKAFPKSQTPENLSDSEALKQGFEHLNRYLQSQKTEMERDGRHRYDMTYMAQHEAILKMIDDIAELEEEMIPPIRIKAAIAPTPRSKTGGRRKKKHGPKSSRKHGTRKAGGTRKAAGARRAGGGRKAGGARKPLKSKKGKKGAKPQKRH